MIRWGMPSFLSAAKLRPMDGVEYVKDSVRYSCLALCQLPPDVLPICTLLTAIFTTGRAFAKLIQGKGGLNSYNVIVIVGSWGGHHALKENRIRAELKKTVNDLVDQLNKTQEQLDGWEKISERENGKVDQLRQSSVSIKNVAQELKTVGDILKSFSKKEKEIVKELKSVGTMINEGIGKGERILDKQKKDLGTLSQSIFEGLNENEITHKKLLEILELMKTLGSQLDIKISHYETLKAEMESDKSNQ